MIGGLVLTYRSVNKQMALARLNVPGVLLYGGSVAPGYAAGSMGAAGATGSIGKSTLDLIERNPDRFEITAVTAASNVEALAGIARRTGAKLAVIADEELRPELQERLAGSGCRVEAGAEALISAATDEAQLVIAAIVGCAGLRPVMAAVDAGKSVALAIKEALVTAGALMTDAARRTGAVILPVDSEHNAIFQCLAGNDRRDRPAARAHARRAVRRRRRLEHRSGLRHRRAPRPACSPAGSRRSTPCARC